MSLVSHLVYFSYVFTPMERYKNLSGTSGISHYFIGDDFIEIKFKGQSTVYIYTYAMSGKHHIENMKSLAVEGLGLGTYISQNPSVRNNYNLR